MRCEFSEFTYGFAVTHEIVTALGNMLPAVPILPSLTDEGSLGYDVRMEGLEGWTFLAQYKIPDRLTRSNASEWAHWGHEYLRFHTRDDSDQHDLLLALESASVFNVVQYLCPCFATADHLNDAFGHGAIEARSLKLRPSEIGAGSHVVTFDAVGNYVVLSEPVRGHASPEERSVVSLGGQRDELEDEARRLDSSLFADTTSALLDLLERVESTSLRAVTDRIVGLQRERALRTQAPDSVQRFAELATIARISIGAQVLVVPRIPQQ